MMRPKSRSRSNAVSIQPGKLTTKPACDRQTFERLIADRLEIGGGDLLALGFARVERADKVYRKLADGHSRLS
jgi:hypothetical protein